MTDAEAEAMLAQLKNHYHEPVQPVSRYCDSLRTWFRAIEKANANGPGQGSTFHMHLRSIELAIRKSNLLARLIYGGEKLRERQCPTHLGRWTGIGLCDHGCHETGWLPEDHPFSPVHIEAWHDQPARTVCQTCGGVESGAVHVVAPVVATTTKPAPDADR